MWLTGTRVRTNYEGARNFGHGEGTVVSFLYNGRDDTFTYDIAWDVPRTRFTSLHQSWLEEIESADKELATATASWYTFLMGDDNDKR
jgi:hypothetical protein